MTEYAIGIDPGQSIDPTAFAAVRSLTPYGSDKPVFHCGFLQRLPLDTRYPDVISHARRLLSRAPFLGKSELVLDLTGVGRPVADMFLREGLRPIKVTITAGTGEHRDKETGIYHVAKLILVSHVQSLLHDGRLQIQKDLADAPVLRSELEDFRASTTDSGMWRFGARSGAHDDLVLSLSLAVWRLNRRQPQRIDPGVVARSAIERRSFDGFNYHSRYPGSAAEPTLPTARTIGGSSSGVGAFPAALPNYGRKR
jgi:hypothetical protein